MVYLDKLSDVSTTQVLAKGMNLKNILKDDFIKELKKKIGKNYEDIIAADIKLMLIPEKKEVPLKQEKKGIIIQLGNADFVRFEHPSPDHYKDNVVVITSNRKENLGRILKWLLKMFKKKIGEKTYG